MSKSVVMFDDVNVDLLPAGFDHYAAYADGRYENVAAVRKRFPKANILLIDVRGSYRNGDVLDVEKGDATNADAVGWFRARKGHTHTPKPVLYTSASNVAPLEATLKKAGIGRDEYFIWSAHYTGKAHICSPKECGYPKADGTQWTSKAMGRSLDQSLMQDYIFATPPADKVPSRNVKVMHASGQFSDTGKQHAADAKLIFDRAKLTNAGWVTTTEGGPGAGGQDWTENFKAAAKAHGFRAVANKGTDAMIAVNEKLIDSDFEAYLGPVIVPGKHAAYAVKRLVGASFHNDRMGTVHVLACHYLLHGEPGGRNADENRAIAEAIGAYAREHGKGSDLVFYAGDQNIVDKRYDTFFEQPLTSAWDELKHWENTGHGNIDVIASYNGDGRVKAVSCHAYPDARFPENSDHFMIEAVYNVRLLKAK